VELMDKKGNSTARYAFIGLIIAAVGCLATGVLALVQGTVALKLFTPSNPNQILQWIGVSAGVLILGLAVYAILNPDGVRRFFTGRQARYGSNALVMALAFIGILVVVNVLVYQNPWSHDFTEDKQHTLAPETIRTLAALPDKVTALAFYSNQTPRDTAQTLLNDLKSNSKGKFDYRFVDPNADPVLARKYGITGDGKIVLTMGKANETASFAGETELTQGMIRLISPAARTVYFLTGHGEPDIEASDTASLARAKQTLESKNYTVKTLNLAATNKIPDDAKALIEAGPSNPMLDQEVTLLRQYLDKGGSLIVLIDPTIFNKLTAGTDPLESYLKDTWGVSFDNDVVIDLTSQSPLNAIAGSYSSTVAITQHTTTFTIMPEARSLQLSQTPPEGVSLTPLISTSQNSWGETDLAALQKNPPQIAFDQAADIAGPLTLAASAESTAKNSRVVVFGNSVFATDKGFDAYANGDIFINSVDWAVQEGNLVNLTPHTPKIRTFNPPSQLQFIAILLGTVILIPGLIVAAGISNWLARRRRG
jgi:ABC-type uncharacterized transport system involved in gliding motility auxiliary subunit